MSEFATLPAYEYAEMNRPQLRWLVVDMVPAPGIVILQGAPFAGKSFLAAQLADAVATGQPFFGYETKQVPVLYLMLESEFIWWYRCRSLRGHLQLAFTVGHPTRRPLTINIEHSDTRRWIMDAVQECNPGLIIVDPIRQIHDGNEDSSTEMKKMMDSMAPFIQGRAVVLVHHDRKPNPMITESAASAGRGSTYMAGLADMIWWLKVWGKRPHKGGTLEIKSRVGETDLKMKQNGETGLWEVEAKR